MTYFTERSLNQKAIYWGNPQNDGMGGFTWDDPVEIDCRWEQSSQIITSVSGVEIVSRANVQVAQDLDEDGRLLLGELVDLDSDTFNDPVEAGASIIMRFDKIPNVKGDQFFRKAYL